MSEQPGFLTIAPSKWLPTDRQPIRAPVGNTWSDFAGWVYWLDDAYELSLPTCWMRHEGVVHALSALWDAWLAVYSRPRSKPAQPADTARAAWHVQFRRPILTDLLDDNGPLARCRRADSHTDYAPRTNQPGRLANALDSVAGEPNSDALRGAAERERFDRMTIADGPAALIAVLYHEPDGD